MQQTLHQETINALNSMELKVLGERYSGASILNYLNSRELLEECMQQLAEDAIYTEDDPGRLPIAEDLAKGVNHGLA